LGASRGAGLDVEVLVVDDASPDGTAAHVRTVFEGDPAVRVHVRHDERGLASAIYRGIQEARGDVVVLMDSDGNHDPTLLPLMVRCVEYFDVVIGSRYVLGGGMLTSRFRYWASYAFNIVIRVVLGLRIHDNLSGFLAIRPLHHVVREGGRVLEIPTVYRFRKGGESKTRFLAYLWTYLASVFRLRFARR